LKHSVDPVWPKSLEYYSLTVASLLIHCVHAVHNFGVISDSELSKLQVLLHLQSVDLKPDSFPDQEH